MRTPCVAFIPCVLLFAVMPLVGKCQAQPLVGVLDEPTYPAHWAATSVDRLKASLERAGIAWTPLTASDLADPATLIPSRIDMVLLPDAPHFPVEAAEPFRAYLRAGGGFVALGGYAFNELVERSGDGWALHSERIGRERAPESLVRANVLPPVDRIPWSSGSALARWEADREALLIDTSPPGAGIAYAVDLQPGRSYILSADVEAQNVRGRGFAFVAYYEMDEHGQIVQWFDMETIRRNGERRTAAKVFVPDPRATRREVRAGTYLTGGQLRIYGLTLAPFPDEVVMTTAKGIPDDGLRTRPEQLGLFDPSHPLEDVAYACPTGRPGLTIAEAVPLTQPGAGWSASGLTFGNQARWVPLLWAQDRYARLNGTVAAVLYHYGGPYAGSVWAYCGLEGDIYEQLGGEAAEDLVLGMLSVVREGLFLEPLRCVEDTYAPDERPALPVTVRNVSPTERQVRLALRDGAEHQEAHVVIPAQGSQTVGFDLASGGGGLRRFSVELMEGSAGRVVDQAEGAIVVRSPSAWPSTPRLAFEDNVFTWDGAARILLGSDAYSVAFTSPAEGPLAWARDLELCRDYGLDVYENLHFSWIDGGFTEHQMRQIEGFAYLAGERTRVYMAGWLVGADTWVSDAVLDDQAAFLRRVAVRTAGAQHLIHYINGDLRAIPEPEVDGTADRFRSWLRERYGGDDALREAWGSELEWPPEEIPFPPPVSDRWDSIGAVDAAHFAVHETRRWNDRLAGALREWGGGQPITNEYYQMPIEGVDLPETIEPLDVANIGFFGHEKGRDLADFSTAVAFADSRARGKGVNVGEFGVKTHPAWSVENGAGGYHIARTKEEERELFVGLLHLGLGLGVSKFQNWCLRDSSENVFPWGLFHPSDVTPKESAYTYRHLSLLAHAVTPIYRPPEVTLLLPDWHRLGNGGAAALEATYRAIEALQAIRVPFNVLPDTYAWAVPEETRVLWWPVPFACSDGTRDAVESFVSEGGRLYLSGDLSYDALRRPTRAERFQRLVGARVAGPAVAPDEWAGGESPLHQLSCEGAEVLLERDGVPLLLCSGYGEGRVVFLNSMAELALSHDALVPLYRAVTRALEVSTVEVQPEDGPVLAFECLLADGGAALILHNPVGEPVRVTAPLAGRRVRALLAPNSPALVAVGADGEWLALSVRGAVAWGGRTLVAQQSGACAVRLPEGVVVAAYGPGDVQLAAPESGPVQAMGEPREGAWQTVAAPTVRPAGAVRLSLDAVDWTLLHILAPAEALEAAGTRVAHILCGPSGG